MNFDQSSWAGNFFLVENQSPLTGARVPMCRPDFLNKGLSSYMETIFLKTQIPQEFFKGQSKFEFEFGLERLGCGKPFKSGEEQRKFDGMRKIGLF